MRMRTLMGIATTLLATASVTACIDDGDRDDDAETDADVVLGGKGDGTLAVTPAEHAIMMNVASYWGVENLRTQVGLSKRAADNIVKAQLGADGQRGTSDDTHFQTIGQLDKVPYVGPVTLQKLRDYTHTLDVFPEGAAERWKVRGGSLISTSTSGIGLWGGTPAAAIDRTGKPVVLYMGSIDHAVLNIGSAAPIDVPTDPQFLAYQDSNMQVAVDDKNAIHVFYGVLYAFNHLVYANGTWSAPQKISGDRLQVANGQNGELYALVRGTRSNAPFADLHTFKSDGTSTVETIPNVPQRTATSIAIAVDGSPVVGWTDAAPVTSTTVPGFKVRRVTTSGAEVSSFAIPSAWTYASNLIVTGATTPTVLLGDYRQSLHLLRDTGSGFAEALVAVQGQGFLGVMSGAAIDSNGLVTACASERDSYHLTEVTVDANGVAERRPLANYPVTRFCYVLTDAQGASHLIYGAGSAFVHAQVE